MVQPTTDELTVRGTIRDGRIVLDVPLNLPEGTAVVFSLRVLSPAPSAKVSNGDSPEQGSETVLTDAELHEWVTQHPAPQSWWDATDNPFAPQPGTKEPPQTQGSHSAEE